MALQPGTRLGPYEVLAPIGAGGMGEVYRARDARLQREVALKILPEGFAVDAERVARFTREAQALAALSHPNIATIYGFEESDGVRALVLELVDGPTLADRIAEGALPLDEALPVARQIAGALAAAHEQGIVHRDLKPANIKLRPDGAVKVLDFGLAKLVEIDPARTGRVQDLSLSPTITSPAVTGMGLILGTAAYMSPEQARGRAVDKRTDVWGFGCVLYEMLSGARAFEGDDATETIAAVVKSTPDWSRLPADTPAALRTLLQGCLEKDPRRRVSDMSTPRYLLGEPSILFPAGAASPQPPAGRAATARRWGVPLIAAATAAVMTGLAAWTAWRPEPPEIARFDIVPAAGQELRLGQVPPGHKVAISRSGSHVFWVGGSGAPGLHARRRDGGTATRLANGGDPFVSPTGEWLGFFQASTRTIRRVSVEGGSSVEIAPYEQAIGGATWGDDDWIVFATTDTATGLQRVHANGGAPEALTKPNRERGENDHLWPRFLPGARAVLFTIDPVPGNRPKIAVLDLRARPPQYKPILENASDARYLSSGHIVYVADGRLYATAFDTDALVTTGPSVPLDIDVTVAGLIADFDVSDNGHLVHATGTSPVDVRRIVWLDPRDGREESIGAEAGAYAYLRLSPDGSTVALDRRDQSDVFTYNLRTRAYERVTEPETLERAPVWWGNTRLIFSSGRAGDTSLFWRASDGTGSPALLVSGKSGLMFASSVAPNGELLLNRLRELPETADLLRVALPRDGAGQAARPDAAAAAGEPKLLLESAAGEINPEVSPDGRFLAYQSNVSGVWKVYVAPYPDPASGRREPVSPDTGIQPLWSRDGRRLFYLTLEGDMMAVPVAAGSRDWAQAAGSPEKLFDARTYYRGDDVLVFRTYDVAGDGRFLMIRPDAVAVTSGPPSMLKVVRNWFAEIGPRLP